MKLLDLFCGGGGSARGFELAGFTEIVGVDLYPQPKYPYKFIQADWLEVLIEIGSEFDLISAGPPCQEYTKAALQWRLNGKQYPNLLNQVRQELIATGKPYVIENVPGSPLIKPIRLNGSCFSLLVHRPRLFESNLSLVQPHIPETKRPVKMGRPARAGDIIQPVGHFSGVKYAQEQMEIDWLGQKELSQAIPPAYTKYIGKQIIEILRK